MPDRIFLFITGLLCAYQIAVGIEGKPIAAAVSYMIAFGLLLVACLLLIILGFEILDSPLVVIVATLIPLSLSFGLVWEFLPAFRSATLFFAILGLAVIIFSRLFTMPGKTATVILVVVHGLSGLVIFLSPIVLSLQGKTSAGFALVGVGGALIGAGGLLLSFLKAGKPILQKETILKVLPGLILLMTAAFVAGFKLE